ncbi:transmembrane protein 164 [Plakobranchus ocellatus]|uniref:Transmembrane protein 164 n=1 Tax=Plakobranchus ocellatus TaxID=259542 RepID=A0AAV3YSB8_9GAST|nr:transmembrane protein 164 [Plakobranchus ocellatus]
MANYLIMSYAKNNQDPTPGSPDAWTKYLHPVCPAQPHCDSRLQTPHAYADWSSDSDPVSCDQHQIDPFIPEKLSDFSWSMTSFGLLFLYHFIPLQVLAYVSQVNLNNMLCPAVSDPFRGKFYRLFAIAHQFVLIPTLGKVFVMIARAFNLLDRDSPQDCQHAVTVITTEGDSCPVVAASSCSLATTCASSKVCGTGRSRACSRSRYDCCDKFYRQRSSACSDVNWPCVCSCCRLSVCCCPPSCRRKSIFSRNRCWSNTSGSPQKTLAEEEKEGSVKSEGLGEDEEGDSGFSGETTSGETINSLSTFSPSAGCAAQSQVRPGEAESSKSYHEDRSEENVQQKSDPHPHLHCGCCCCVREKADNSTVESDHHHCCRQQRLDWGQGNTTVQHIVNGQMVTSKNSRSGQGDVASTGGGDGRSAGQAARQRKKQDHNHSTNNGSPRNSGEIIVEGGPPLRVFDLKNCGNSIITSSVEKAIAGGTSGGSDDDRDDYVMAEFWKRRSKVH